jgi:hypothetical protein
MKKEMMRDYGEVFLENTSELLQDIRKSRGAYIVVNSSYYLHHDGEVRKGVDAEGVEPAFWETVAAAQEFFDEWKGANFVSYQTKYEAVVAELEEAQGKIKWLSTKLQSDDKYFADRLNDQANMHSQIVRGLEATVAQLMKPLIDQASVQLSPMTIKIEESPVMLAKIEADAIRECLKVTQGFYDDTLEYADKLEAGTL